MANSKALAVAGPTPSEDYNWFPRFGIGPNRECVMLLDLVWKGKDKYAIFLKSVSLLSKTAFWVELSMGKQAPL